MSSKASECSWVSVSQVVQELNLSILGWCRRDQRLSSVQDGTREVLSHHTGTSWLSWLWRGRIHDPCSLDIFLFFFLSFVTRPNYIFECSRQTAATFSTSILLSGYFNDTYKQIIPVCFWKCGKIMDAWSLVESGIKWGDSRMLHLQPDAHKNNP